MRNAIRAGVFALLFLVPGASIPAQASEDGRHLSAESFTSQFVKALQAKAPGLSVKQAGRLHLKVGAGKRAAEDDRFTVYLDNAYTRYVDTPTNMNEIIDEYVAGLLETMASREAKTDVSRIVPVIKDADYIANLRRNAGRGANGAAKLPAYEHLNPYLVVLYAEDRQRSLRYLPEEDLKKIGFSKENRRAKAIANLKALLPKIQLRGGSGSYMLTAGGTYEASLLLFDRIWKGGQIDVKGELVVAAPSRDMLLVTGSKDAEGLKKIRRIAAEVMNSEAYRLTDRLFVYRGGRFVAFNG